MTASLAQNLPPVSGASRRLLRGGPAAAAQDDRPIDLVHLARQTFGEKRLETELLRMFMHQARQIMASLASDAAGGTAVARPPAADLLHTLVGSARVVGAFAVATCAETLEQDLRRAGDATVSGLGGASDTGRAELATKVDAACSFITALLGLA